MKKLMMIISGTLVLGLCIGFFSSFLHANSIAKKQFLAFLEAFNSKDPATLKQFIMAHESKPEESVGFWLNLQKRDEAYILKEIIGQEQTKITALLEGQGFNDTLKLSMDFEEKPPHLIKGFRLQLINNQRTPMAEKELITTVQEYLQSLAAKSKFSGSVLIAKDGKPIFTQAYGLADRATQKANKLDTKFNLGSMNKMFTAIAIAQLAQAGKLKFTDTVGDYLPDYENKDVAKVTIDQLLTHMGGTGDTFGPEFEANIEKLQSPSDYVNLFCKRELTCKPGTEWKYSNYGFVLLGAIIEKISGEDYYTYIRKHIYKPAGMINSDSYFKTEKTPNLALGYPDIDPTSTETNYKTLPMRGSPAGGGYSTVEDLLSFANALHNNKLLNQHYTDLVLHGKTKLHASDNNSAFYAYGFFDEIFEDLHCFGHGGGASGINSDFKMCTSGYTVIVMSNNGTASHIEQFIINRLPKK